MRAALAEVQGCTPTKIQMEAELTDGAEDEVLAVNLSKPVAATDLSEASEFALRIAREMAAKHVGARRADAVPLRHFLGGPCNQEHCAVLVLLPPPLGLESATLRGLHGFNLLEDLNCACGTDLRQPLHLLQIFHSRVGFQTGLVPPQDVVIEALAALVWILEVLAAA